jgi:hypothetical protein
MPTPIEICNIALIRLGSDTIRDFDKATKRARACEGLYPIVRDQMLEKYDWSFARGTTPAPLRVSAEHPVDPILGTPYDLPVDCLKPRDVLPLGTDVPWEVVQDRLYTRLQSPRLRYTRKNITPGLFSASFSSALAFHLALELVPVIKAETELVTSLRGQALQALAEAQDEDAQRGSTFLHNDTDPNNDPFVNPDIGARHGTR